MSYTYVFFPWSKKNQHSWIITTQNLNDKKYTYYFNGDPIHTIVEPYIIRDTYMTNILLIKENDMNWISININDIQEQNEMRDHKLNTIL